MDAPNGSAPGLFNSLRRLADTLLSLIHNRIELFAVEFQEEKQWLIAALLWTAATVFCAAGTVVLLLVAVLTFCPEPARPWVLLGLSVVFLLGGIRCGLRLRGIFQRRAAFSATLQEFEKDLSRLRAKE